MEKVRLGSSNVKITPLVFGAWAIGGWMWGGTDIKKSNKAVQASIESGMTTIDTAPAYGFGLSESIIGNATAEIPREKYQLLTKFGLRWDTSSGHFYFESQDAQGKKVNMHKYAGKESIIKECEESLQRLKTDYIDLYQIHWPDPTTPIEESFEAVEQLLTEGKILAAGVCNYDLSQIEAAQSVVPLASNQVPYSMVLRTIEKEIVPYCISNNMGILAYSPLQRGLLTGKISDDYKFNSGDHRADNNFFQQPNLGIVNKFLNDIRPIAEKYKASLTQLVINWTIQQPGITGTLVGARNEEQVVHNAKSLQFKLTADELHTIKTKLESLPLQ